MKLFSPILLAAAITAFFVTGAAAQKKTIILVRHAEKDAAQAEMSGDPELSAAGKERAERLVQVVRKYKPGAVYSTDTRRTRATAEPMAKHRHLEIRIYDPRKTDDLVKQITESKTKRFLIVGHSNTVPGLANLLGKKEIFKNLDDGEYGVIWLVKINNGQVKKVEIRTY
jgi:phosphohistidine phosphatase SixA